MAATTTQTPSSATAAPVTTTTTSKPKEFFLPANPTGWKARLITKEDFMHVHKTLGLACLASFVWRISQCLDFKADMGFRSYPHLTIPTILLHLALSLSALEFKIPSARIKEGTRIWPEYRLHSIVFATRSLAAMALYWYEDRTQQQPYYPASAFIVLATIAAADCATASQTHQSKSIRDLDTSPAVRYFFSMCQFYATTGVLFGIRRSSMQFVNVFVMQLTPFIMTLRRKNILPHYGTVAIYGFMLLFGAFINFFEYSIVGGESLLCTRAICGNLAFLWRTTPLGLLPPSVRRVVQNKYLIWSVMAVLVHYVLRPMSEEPMTPLRHKVYSYSLLMVFLNGYMKCTAATYSDEAPTKNKLTVKKVS